MNIFSSRSSAWRRLCFTHDPDIGWWHIPNLKALLELGGKRHLFQTNAVGMRTVNNYPFRTPAGRRRIVLLGDSYTAGDGVSNGERFCDFLEHMHPRLDILNFGCNGTATDQQMLVYEHKASSYEHDMVLWCVCVENIVRNICTCRPSYNFQEHHLIYRPKPWFTFEGENLSEHSRPVSKEYRRNDCLGDWCMASYDGVYDHYLRMDDFPWQLMRAFFFRVAKAIAPRPLCIVPLPMVVHYMQQETDKYHDAFASLENTNNNIKVVDLLPAFLRRPYEVRKGYAFATDPHYTAEAHRLVAETLDVVLATLYPDIVL